MCGCASIRAVQPPYALLAHALLDFNRDFERRASEVEEHTSLLVWADFLRVVADDGISVSDLPATARISRRAAQAWLRRSPTNRWVEITAQAPRVKIAKLTDAGRRTRDNCEAIAGSTEQAWCAKVGEADAKGARAALEDLVGGLELELAHYPIIYGASDWSVLGGPWVAAKPGPPRIPAHGADWVPVVRGDGDTVSRLPLAALLSQALMAFLVDYEDRMPFPMAVAALLAQTMPAGAVRLADVPSVLAVDGGGRSGLERHGVVNVTGRGDQRVARLTPTGVRIRDAYEPTVDDVERAWRKRYGDETVSELVTALARIDSKLPSALPDHVLVRHVMGVGLHDVSIATMR